MEKEHAKACTRIPFLQFHILKYMLLLWSRQAIAVVYTREMSDVPTDIIVDSDMVREDILAQNPESRAPQDTVDSLDIIPLSYWGFDGVLHCGQIVMHKSVMQDTKQFFDAALEMKFPIQKVIPISNGKYTWNDAASCSDNNSSGYNYRRIAGTNKISQHARGCAFDINPVQNIYIHYGENREETFRFPESAVYDENARGTLTAAHPLVLLMKRLGWEWGGDWKPESGRTDYQHFEKHI